MQDRRPCAGRGGVVGVVMGGLARIEPGPEPVVRCADAVLPAGDAGAPFGARWWQPGRRRSVAAFCVDRRSVDGTSGTRRSVAARAFNQRERRCSVK